MWYDIRIAYKVKYAKYKIRIAKQSLICEMVDTMIV